MKIACIGEERLTPELIHNAALRLGDGEFCDYKLSYQQLVAVEKLGAAGMPVPACFDDMSEAEIAICHYCTFSDEGLEKLPNLKVIATLRAGIENLDVDAATKRGIACVHCPGRNAEAVSDHAVALLLTEVLNISRAHSNMMKGIWEKNYVSTPMTPLFNGKTVGIFGFGTIARMTARKLSGFQMKIIAYDPFVSADTMADCGVQKVEKDELFKQSKFIIVHSRLTPETHHIIGKQELAMMKPDSWLVNNARSGLIDMDALLEALQEHKIAGAALDVFDQEPLPQDSPFLKLDNVTLTPHIAGAATETRAHAAKMAVDGVESILNGKPNFQVLNPEVLKQKEFQNWLKRANTQLGRNGYK